jgi:hypothetical protein
MMTRLLFLLTLACAQAHAQPKLVTEFPAGAAPLSAQALKERFTGARYAFTGANGAEITLQFRETDATIGSPRGSDTGPWTIEGSAICFKLTKFPSGCNEVRLVGTDLYWERASNGEVVKLYRP